MVQFSWFRLEESINYLRDAIDHDDNLAYWVQFSEPVVVPTENGDTSYTLDSGEEARVLFRLRDPLFNKKCQEVNLEFIDDNNVDIWKDKSLVYVLLPEGEDTKPAKFAPDVQW
jgi:hypothetical protein